MAHKMIGDYFKRRESDIKRMIKMHLEGKGCLVIDYRSVGIMKPNGSYIPMSKRGVSDLLGLTREGKFFAIEVKTEAGRLSQEQKRFIEVVKSHGCKAFVAKSVEDVIKEGL